MVGFEVKSDEKGVYLKLGLCKGMGDITGTLYFGLEHGEAQDLAEQLFQASQKGVELE